MQNFTKLLDRFQKQYLSCYPINLMNWQDLAVPLDLEAQELLLQHTQQHSLNKKQPLKRAYQLHFLRTLIQFLEKQNQDNEVLDAIYISYCDLIDQSKCAEENDYTYKHYALRGREDFITMLESKCVVAGGTTGLCTWQAAIALADFILQNPDIVHKKNILELGAGSGLCGILLKRHLNVTEVVMTDGSLECLHLMQRNIDMNFTPFEQPLVLVRRLRWDKCSDYDWNELPLPDIILASDITYNTEHFPDLVNCIKHIFEICANKVKMLLTATIRNEETFSNFIEYLIATDFNIQRRRLNITENNALIYDSTTPVDILIITR